MVREFQSLVTAVSNVNVKQLVALVNTVLWRVGSALVKKAIRALKMLLVDAAMSVKTSRARLCTAEVVSVSICFTSVIQTVTMSRNTVYGPVAIWERSCVTPVTKVYPMSRACEVV